MTLISSKKFSLFYFASPEIIEVKQTDGQTDKFFDIIYGVCGFVLQVQFANSLHALLAGVFPVGLVFSAFVLLE